MYVGGSEMSATNSIQKTTQWWWAVNRCWS